MTLDVSDPDLEPKWRWATRVTAESARAAMAEGRTPQERFEIYERLIIAACEKRQRTCREPNTSITEVTASTQRNLLYNFVEVDDNISISAFDDAGPADTRA
jgi:hypothetical protein